MNKHYDISPFVKWAGGKRQLLPRLSQLIPNDYAHYFEPFIGGGALLMDLQPKKAIINDSNTQLINTYSQIKDNVFSVIEKLTIIDKNLLENEPKEYFYKMRELYNSLISNEQLDATMAALFIFLNKHCFNGLYRVNSKGFFNVPYNNSICPSFSENNLINLSKYLKKVTLLNEDFEGACKKAKKNDLVFFDSPYAPLNLTSFDSYTKTGFAEADHIRLSNLFKKLTKKGCYCILTNHNTELINSLYADFKIEHIDVRRAINSDASKRIGKEVIITNF